VLLVWGEAGEKWCGDEFENMVRQSKQARSRGLCLFDPKESKLAIAQQIRTEYSAIHVAEQYGEFNPALLEPFFKPLRKAQGEAA